MLNADTRLSDTSAAMSSGSEGWRGGAYAGGDNVRLSHGESGEKSSENGKFRCERCGKTTSPPYWTRSCTETSSAQSRIDALFIVNDDRNVATRPSFTCITTVTCHRHKFGNCDSAGSHTAGRSCHPKDLPTLVWQRGMSRLPEQQGMWFGTR